VLELTGGTGQWSLITGRVALEDLVEQGFDTLINHKARRWKVLVHP
jgi:(R,R)-butanediol dehydrogenase/meso-butanediol dehydrogenase/diacetyl reductase